MNILVGVHFRLPRNISSFGPQKVYVFGDISFMASHGADLSSTRTTQLRLTGDLFFFFFVFVRGRFIQTQAMHPRYHDACNDKGSRIRTNVFRLSGILNKINRCNDYHATLCRWNPIVYVICIIRKPLHLWLGWTFHLSQRRVWGDMQLYWYKDAHRAPDPFSFKESCWGGMDGPVHITWDGEEKKIV